MMLSGYEEEQEKMFYWKTDSSWYVYDGCPLYGISLTDAAPERAQKSFKLWQEETREIAKLMGIEINEHTPTLYWHD